MLMSLTKPVWIIIGFSVGFIVGHLSSFVTYLRFEELEEKALIDIPSRRATLDCSNRTKMNAFRVLPKRLVSVFGLESSGTTFLAETLAKATGANSHELLQAITKDVKGSRFFAGGVRDDLRYSNREVEIQHISLPWGYYSAAASHGTADTPPTMEFIAPRLCMSYPLYRKPDLQAIHDKEAPHPSCYIESGIKERVRYPPRFFVDIASHVQWYQQRGTNATAVIMVRDQGIHLHGKQNHNKNLSRSIEEDNVGKAIIAKAIKELDFAAGEIMLVSYETLMSLKEVYLFDIYKKLGIMSTFTPVFKNGNEKYIRQPLVHTLVHWKNTMVSP